jgi:hypothetical protein
VRRGLQVSTSVDQSQVVDLDDALIWSGLVRSGPVWSGPVSVMWSEGTRDWRGNGKSVVPRPAPVESCHTTLFILTFHRASMLPKSSSLPTDNRLPHDP